MSRPAYGFRRGIREQSGAEGYSSGNRQLYQVTVLETKQTTTKLTVDVQGTCPRSAVDA